jgi:hypothetical protein
MIVGTALGIFFVPLFFVMIRSFLQRRKKPAAGGDGPAHPAAEGSQP